MSAARQLVPRRCPGCGTNYGTAAARANADRVEHAQDPRRAWIAAAAELGRLVAGGQLVETFAEELVLELGDAIGRDHGEARRTWRWALRRGHVNPRVPTSGSVTSESLVEDLLKWWIAVTADPELVKHRSGAAAMKILGGAFIVAIGAHRIEIGLSLRQMAECGGVSLSTVKRTRPLWLRHLTVVKAGDRRRGERAIYRFRIPDTDAHSEPKAGGHVPRPKDHGVILRAPSSGDLGIPGGNVWHQCPGCWATYSTLDPVEPTTPREIARRINRHPGTVRKQLRRLAEQALAIEVDGGWVRVPDAEEPPGPDHAAERRARHAAERKVYRRWLDTQRIENEEHHG